MLTNNIIVREYLNSLKEDEELDKLLPILLSIKGLKIVRTAKDTKGVNQQGKDIIAYGMDKDGIAKRFYFEVKGHSDKDITEASMAKTDGIRDSLVSAKYAKFEQNGIPGFNDLPVKIILVHNGILKPGARDVFNGFIVSLFADGEREFEHWDIHRLTDEFNEHLFSEYLLTDEESIRLFKRTLVLMEVPDYNLEDFYLLVDKLLSGQIKVKGRSFTKMFASLNLISYILWHYSKENKNLLPAIKGTSYLILRTWAWILKNELQSKPAVMEVFKTLLKTHYEVLRAYYEKTLPAAVLEDGLFSEPGGSFEDIGYSLRSMDYLAMLIYYFGLEEFIMGNYMDYGELNVREHRRNNIKTLFSIIDNNDGCKRPLLDMHSRPILLISEYIMGNTFCSGEDIIQLNNYLVHVLDGIAMIEVMRHRLPELNDNISALIETAASRKKSAEYKDGGSMLILAIIEMLAVVGNAGMYSETRSRFQEIVNFQTAYPNWETDPKETEIAYFSGNIADSMVAESSIELPEDFHAFIAQVMSKPKAEVPFVTDAIGLSFLKSLSIVHFKNDVFPSQWRRFLSSNVKLLVG
ncbi:hypothetical protein AAHN97_06325 [Chitinophaga niabensis]|uniref:hypothetical protein n=1 Tax=Chitinophaga niabensis TaxID=536979 RepID=UPI0031BB7B9A